MCYSSCYLFKCLLLVFSMMLMIRTDFCRDGNCGFRCWGGGNWSWDMVLNQIEEKSTCGLWGSEQ